MRLMDEESFWIFRDHIFTWWCFIRVPRETTYLHSCHQSHCYIILQIPWILLASKWLVLSQRCLLPFLWILHWHSAPIGPPPVTFTMANHICLLHRYIQVNSRKGWSEIAKSAICTSNAMLEQNTIPGKRRLLANTNSFKWTSKKKAKWLNSESLPAPIAAAGKTGSTRSSWRDVFLLRFALPIQPDS